MRNTTSDTVERLLSEDLVTAAEACQLPGLKPISPKQFYDVLTNGRKSVTGETIVLERIRVASGIRTSKQAVRRFVMKLSGATQTAPPTTRRGTRSRQISDAERQLAAAGML